jgi:cation-transporting ATPase 13A3/4/5
MISPFSPNSAYLNQKSVILNEAMASCHAITHVGDNLVGDPLDIKMFQTTDWELDEKVERSNSILTGDDILLAKVRMAKQETNQNFQKCDDSDNETPSKYELAIIKRYDFEAALQRMSVVVKHSLDKSLRIYVKGSPEKIAELCHSASIPPNYHTCLEEFTRKGYRVIALAFKPF